MKLKINDVVTHDIKGDGIVKMIDITNNTYIIEWRNEDYNISGHKESELQFLENKELANWVRDTIQMRYSD